MKRRAYRVDYPAYVRGIQWIARAILRWCECRGRKTPIDFNTGQPL